MKDPEAELKATIEVLKSHDEKKIFDFACRFPRRYSYLAPKLGLDSKKYFCDNHISWRESFEASGVSLMFASQYLENPASSFGHTYLKINSTKKALYLNKVISFAAEVPEKVNAAEYVWKGLVGGFPGKFNSYPFYILYHEYANLEKRDIWEYELEFSPKATERLLDSLYEIVHNAEFDYMFLTENCSALLLRLLDQEFQTNLSDDLPFYVIPIQTVKVLKDAKLIRKSIFHPSITSRMTSLTVGMNKNEKKESLEFIDGEKKLDSDSSARTLDLGLEYLNFKRQKQGGDFSREQKEDLSRYLVLRSQKASYPSKVEKNLDPIKTPKSQRLSLAGQNLNRDATALALTYRPVGKDFFDRPNGFVEESEINIFKTKFYFSDHENKSWADVDLIGIRKYGDYNPITKNSSWGVNLAYKSSVKEGEPDSYFAELDSHYGYGKNIIYDILGYLVFHPTVRFGNIEHHTNFLPQFELGLIQSHEWMVWKLSGFSGLIYDGYKKRSFQSLRGSFSWILSEDLSLNLSNEYYHQDKSWNATELGMSYYF